MTYCAHLSCFQHLPCLLHEQPLDRDHIFSQFHVWYPTLRKWSVRSRTIELPPDFVRFLQQDGIVLPESLATTQAISSMDPTVAEMYDYDSESEEFWKKVALENQNKQTTAKEPKTRGGEESSDSEDEEWQGPFFTELVDAITEVIGSLRGKVFPRINWRSPRDASWINSDNTLACTKPGDVILLLKSSDLIAEDLSLLAQHKLPVFLNLRQWSNLSTANEFRCFVADGRLLAASQHIRDFYHHLSDEDWLFTIKLQLSDFFDTVLVSRVPLRRYVFDAYMETGTNKVFILNIKPWAPATDPVLFEWDELEALAKKPQEETKQTNFELRVIKEAFESRRTVGGIVNRLPLDGIDLSDQTAINSFVERISQVPSFIQSKETTKAG